MTKDDIWIKNVLSENCLHWFVENSKLNLYNSKNTLTTSETRKFHLKNCTGEINHYTWLTDVSDWLWKKNCEFVKKLLRVKKSISICLSRFLILFYWHWMYSLHYANQNVKYFQIHHSVETVSEVSRRSSVQIVTYVKQKTWSKSKSNWEKRESV